MNMHALNFFICTFYTVKQHIYYNSAESCPVHTFEWFVLYSTIDDELGFVFLAYYKISIYDFLDIIKV